MKKRLFSLLLAVIMIVGLLPVTAMATGGNWAIANAGTAADPYQISDAADLAALATAVNGGESYSGKYFVLTQNIDMSAVTSWVAIGNNSNKFAGVFDGKGFKIQGLLIKDMKGFFGYTTTSATIMNVVFEDCSMDVGAGYSGLCVGENRGSVLNIHSTYSSTPTTLQKDSVSGPDGIGGIVGANYGIVDGCSNANIVKTTVDLNSRTGGIVGFNFGNIRNSYNTGTISGVANQVGGIAGESQNWNNASVTGSCSIENCFNWGTISGNADVGGIVGDNHSSTVVNCYNGGSVSSKYSNDTHGHLAYNSTNGTLKHSFGIAGKAKQLYSYASTVSECSVVADTNDAKAGLKDTLNAWVDQQNAINPGKYKQWIFEDYDPGPKFDPNTYYTLSYEVNGGALSDSGYTPAGKVAAGTDLDLPTSDEITRANWVFDGWYLRDMTTPAPDEMPESDLTLYAKWHQEAEYTIEHYQQNLDGTYPETATESETKTGEVGEVVTADPKSYDGFTYTVVDGLTVEEGVVTNGVTAEPLVLKLFYNRNLHKVTYQPGKHGAFSVVEHTDVRYGSETPAAPTATGEAGYTFTGWSPAVAETVTGDVDYVAQWEATHTAQDVKVAVLFTDSEGNAPVSDDVLAAVEAQLDANLVPNSNTAKKWLPVGYIRDLLMPVDTTATEDALDRAKAGLETPGVELSVAGQNDFDLKIVSDWTANYYTDRNVSEWRLNGRVKVYTVEFESNGGTAVNAQYIIENFKATKPADPTKASYTFGGWYVDQDLEEEYDFDTVVTDDITLYAKWEQTPVDVYVLFTDHTGVREHNLTEEDFPNIKGLQDGLALTPNGTPKDWLTIGRIPHVDVDAADALDQAVEKLDEMVPDESNPNFPYGVVDRWELHHYLQREWRLDGYIKTYDLTYDANGGTNAPADDFFYLNGTEVTLSTTAPTHADVDGVKIIFAGWSADQISDILDKDAADPTLITKVTMAKDETVYAVWAEDVNENATPDYLEPQYTVTYTDGVNGKAFEDQVTEGLLPGVATPEFDGTPKRPGYIFIDWKPAVEPTVTGNAVYEAQWRLNLSWLPLLGGIDPIVEVEGLNTVDHVAYVVGRGDNKFVPTGTVTRAEAATMFFRLMTDSHRNYYWDNSCTYTDVAGDAWYNVAIATLEAAGVIQDTAAYGKFRPNEPITRAEMAVMAAQFCDVTGSVPHASFYDVAASHWAADEIAIMEYAGFIQGFNGYYRPEDTITRAECVTIINRMLERGAEAENMLPAMVTFVDVKPDAWYYEAVQEAANSHTYTRTNWYLTNEFFYGELWLTIEKAPDWAAMEQIWAAAHK